MDSNAEPIVQAETPDSGPEEQVKQDATHPVEATAEPTDDDDAILARMFADDAEEPVAEEPVAPPAPAAESPTFDREAAAKVLKRDGVPDEIIASASPETLSKWAESASKRQKDVDSYGGRLKQMEEQLAKAAGTPTEAAQDNKPAPAAAPDDPFAQMAETYGEDLVAPVRTAFQMQQQRMQEQILLAQARAADISLRAQFGAKAPSYDAVLAKMNELGNASPGGYASVDALTAAAYEALVGSKPTPAVNARASQPTAPKGAPAPVKPPPRDEDDEILDQILTGAGERRLRPSRN